MSAGQRIPTVAGECSRENGEKRRASAGGVDIRTATFRGQKRVLAVAVWQTPRKSTVFVCCAHLNRALSSGGAPESTQDCAVSLQKCVCPAVSAKSKLRDRRFLRLPVTCSQQNPRSTPPITAATSANAQALRLSGCVNSTTSKIAPLIISRHPFPPQLSPLSDSYVAPGDYLTAG